MSFELHLSVTHSYEIVKPAAVLAATESDVNVTSVGPSANVSLLKPDVAPEKAVTCEPSLAVKLSTSPVPSAYVMSKRAQKFTGHSIVHPQRSPPK